MHEGQRRKVSGASSLLWFSLAALGLAAVVLFRSREDPVVAPAGRTLLSEAYVWQRQWGREVAEAIRTAEGDIDSFCLLAAEMQWKNGAPEIRRVSPDWPAVKGMRKPPGVVIRIFPSVAQTGWNPPALGALAKLLGEIRQDFSDHNATIGEIQLDYDCPESKLDDYTRLLRELKNPPEQPRLTITALPAWLKRPAFAALAREAPGYVLQVHSLHLPQNGSGLVTLCDPAEARAAVRDAARLKVPFRVALPTYSCVVQFDAAGKVSEVYAEDLPANFPHSDLPYAVLDADAFQCANLLAGWRANGPADLQSVIWYRLPVTTDRLNWHWPVLQRLCQGEPLGRGWKVEAMLAADLHYDILIRNAGDAPDDLPKMVSVRAEDGGIAASDGLRGYAVTPSPSGAFTLRLEQPARHARAAPGKEIVIGWCRTSRERAPVRGEVISP